MNDYFAGVKQGLGDAVERQAHLRWYTRLLRASSGRPLAVVLAVLVVATPAVAAVTGWFSFGKPNVPPPAKAGYLWGLERPGSSRLLPIRVKDPFGGPSWGLRIVQTSRGDTCVQLGRVENGQLGSLGIEDAWNNDQQFHAISARDSADDECGSTDADGYGYVNRAVLGEQASANIYHRGQGSSRTTNGCRPPQYLYLMGNGHRPQLPTHAAATPSCPANGARVVFFGLLGRDAVSVTYRKPGGGLATEPTTGGVGAYLLVFPYTAATCEQYSHSASGAVSCDSESMGGVSPGPMGAVTKITYRDGRSCSIGASPGLRAAYKTFIRTVIAKLGRPKPAPNPGAVDRVSAKWDAAYRRMLSAFLLREHLTLSEFRAELAPVPSCPAVGWVAYNGPKITAAQVKTPIVMRVLAAGNYGCPVPASLHLPDGCAGASEAPSKLVPVEWSFEARRAVTTSRSWYEWAVWPASSRTKTNCGGSSFATYTNVRRGQMLRYSNLYPTDCRGKYTVTVGYMAGAPPGQQDNGGGGFPGRDGSILVGRASFTIH